MENKNTHSTHSPPQLYQLSSNVQSQQQQQQQQLPKQEPQSHLPTSSNINQLESITNQQHTTNTNPQMQTEYEYSTMDTLSNQYLMQQQSQQPHTRTPPSFQQQQQQPPLPPQHQQQVMGTPPQVVPPTLNMSTSTPQVQSTSSAPPPSLQQFQGFSTTNIHDELSRSSAGLELRHSHSFPAARPFYQAMQPPLPPGASHVQQQQHQSTPDPDPQGSSLNIIGSPSALHTQPQHGFYPPPPQPIPIMGSSSSVTSSLPSSANTSTLTITSTTASTTNTGGAPPIPFSVPTHIDVNQYPDMTTLVNSNANIVVPLVEHRFVDNKVCIICGKKITRDMSRHMRTHQAELRFNCKFPKNQCRHKLGKFNRPYDFKKHLLNRHFKFDDPSIKRLHNLSDKLNHWGTCPCGLRFLGKDWLDDHILTDDPTKKCPFIE